MKEKIKVTVHFEDKGQDFLSWTIEFDKDYVFGVVIDSPGQQSPWVGMPILSGKPEIGQYLEYSPSPDHPVFELLYAITAIDWEPLQSLKKQDCQ